MTDEELCENLRLWNCPEAAERIEALRADLKSTRIRIEIIQTVCRGLARTVDEGPHGDRQRAWRQIVQSHKSE